MSKVVPVGRFLEMAGTDLGVSEWRRIDQNRIDAFAEVTEDRQFIHVDPEAAARTPLGATIAHGFLTLSLVVPMFYELAVYPENMTMSLNYGVNRVRFLAPVVVDSRVRLHASRAEVREKSPGSYLAVDDVTMEIEGKDRPALVGQFLTLSLVAA